MQCIYTAEHIHAYYACICAYAFIKVIYLTSFAFKLIQLLKALKVKSFLKGFVISSMRAIQIWY